MQPKMLENQMSEDQINNLLLTAPLGRLGTINAQGYPYVIAMHFVYLNGAIYLHGRLEGEKTDNIKNNPKVCFEIDEILKIVTENLQSPAHATTKYRSVVVLGKAALISDKAEKEAALDAFTNKYTPQMKGFKLPEAMISVTGVFKIDIEHITGKQRK